MGLIARFLAAAGLWLLVRSQRSRAPDLHKRIQGLPWSKRAQFVWNVARDERVPLVARGLVFWPSLYVLSPIDLVPDFFPLIGRLDDTAVLAMVVGILLKAAPRSVLESHLDRLEMS